MKLYAQHGHADGEKSARGLEMGSIDGVIYGPKDISLGNLRSALQEMEESSPQADRLFDPQVYAAFLATQADSRMGHLAESYLQPEGYFSSRRRSQFESEERVKDQLRRAIQFQQELNLSAIIAPNIYISSSCNSIEAAISKSFLRFTKPIANEVGVRLPVFATLAISRDALVNVADYIDFLSDITVLDTPPDGFYLMVGASKPDARPEIFNSDVIAGWMLLNRTLSENGFRVINGYSDLISPFLGIAGAEAGATGWWSNLRVFSLDRFSPALPGGSLPTVRYLSQALLGRVSYFELEQIRAFFPAILNGLPTDTIYTDHDEPSRREEVLQTWQALKAINENIVVGDIGSRLQRGREAIQRALVLKEQIQHTAIRLESKSDGSHLEPLLASLTRFAELAELT